MLEGSYLLLDALHPSHAGSDALVAVIKSRTAHDQGIGTFMCTSKYTKKCDDISLCVVQQKQMLALHV
jgi:hypothetical protein